MKNTKHSNVYFSGNKSKVFYSGEKEILGFNLMNISIETKTWKQQKNTSNWDNTLTLSLELKRDFKDHLISIFFPELLLWFIAYITIFLKIYDISNRSRISVTILLVLVALIGSVKDIIPHTPYFKYVDIWSIWYLSNIFLIVCFHIFMEASFNQERTESNKVFGTFVGDKKNVEDLMANEKFKSKCPVSYTHLTLPTKA